MTLISVIGVLVFMSLARAQDPQGTPGVDYPNYFTIPETSFKCSEQKYNPGFYADLETKCQAFHFCYRDRQESFLCPTGTIFNQAVLTCDIWHKSNCSLSQMFYSVNAGPVMERAGKNLPMLLRLRNRSQSVPKQTTTSTLDESYLKEVDNETPTEHSTSSPDIELIASNHAIKSSDSPNDFESENREQMISDGHYNELGLEKDTGEEALNSELPDETEEQNTNLVYDSVNDGYYRNYLQYEDEWQETEPISDEFREFYDYRDLKSDYGHKVNEAQMNYINEDFKVSDQAVEDYTEFAKRGSPSSRYRRKPVYVVLDQPEVRTGVDIDASENDLETNEDLSESNTREGKEMNLTSEPTETTARPEPFPRPTRIPPHKLELSTETPMTSDEFGAAIFSELVIPHLPEDYGEVIASTYPEHKVSVSQSEQISSETRDTQNDDETIYIENDLEPESYVPYDSQYEASDPDESYEQSYSQYQDQESDAEDTFVVIPDEYDENMVDSQSTDELEMGYPEEAMYEAQMYSDDSNVAGYGTYGNSFPYTSAERYPQYYGQVVNYDPEMNTEVYRHEMSDERYAYENGYHQPMDYASSSYDTANSYVRTERYPYEEADFETTEPPLQLPVTEADLDNFSNEDFNEVSGSEQDLIEDGEESGKSEDVFYVLDDEESSETEESENVSSLEESPSEYSEHARDQYYETKQINSTNESNSASNESLNIESERLDESTQTENYRTTSQSEQFSDTVKPAFTANQMNSLSSSNFGQAVPNIHESSTSRDTPFSSNVGSFDFSTDPRFLSNMGFSESMDFGPYGFGPNMGQQFSMMESMQQGNAGNPFGQRIGQTEQPKISPLSAIQEKMRSMKQGKFGAFKKYMSSTKK